MFASRKSNAGLLLWLLTSDTTERFSSPIAATGARIIDDLIKGVLSEFVLADQVLYLSPQKYRHKTVRSCARCPVKPNIFGRFHKNIALMKFRLDVDGMTDDFFSETRLLGIMAPIKNYQFCWQLNNLLGYNFRLNTDIELQMIKKGRPYFFSLYHHAEKNSSLSHYIYHNHCNGEYLLPEFRHMDFLWLMKGDWVDDAKCLGITASIKSINGVQMVAELTNEKIRNKENMMF